MPELSVMPFTESHKIKVDKYLVNVHTMKDLKSQAQSLRSIIPVLGRLRQDNYHKLEASLDYVVRSLGYRARS